MKKFKEFCKKPITWGDYFKLCGVVAAVTTVAEAAWFGYWYRDEIGVAAKKLFQRKEEIDVEEINVNFDYDE